MYITKKHLPRRTILRGFGAAVALPVLESMVPAMTALAQTAAKPARRLGVFYVPNGMAMSYWSPKGEGPIGDLPPTLASLASVKDQILMMGGLYDEAANLVKGGGDHARSAGTFLTCVPFKFTYGADVFAATTMDQLAAKEFARQTQLASLELALDSNAILGSCDGGSSCAYTNTIAWSTPTTPLPMENDPRAVFERLFGTSGSTDAAARLSRIKQDRSILDFISEELARLDTRIGKKDRQKLDEFVESIRDVERRIQKAEEQNSRELPVVHQPMGIPNDYATHAKLMMDLLALAYQTDLTRVATFMLAKEVSSRAYPEIGVSDSHHPLSHHQNEAAKLERLHKINQFHMQQFAHLVEKMKSIPEGDGTMLDNSIFLYGTGISDSNTHFHDDLPIAVVGGKATGIRGGRYVRYKQGTPLANLHVTLLERLGVRVEKFGDSSGKLENLSV
jgi:hypothetical protein